MTKRRAKALLLALVMGITAVFFPSCSAAETYRLVKVNGFEGEVSVQREEKLSAFEGLQLVSEDSVEVGNASFLELLADSDKHIAAEENTGFVIHSEGTEENGSIRIDLLYGKSLFTIDNKLPDNSTFDVKTPNATLSVRGTSFSVAYDPEEKTTSVEVFSGKVSVSYDDKELYLEKGATATIRTKDDITEIISNSPSYNSSTTTSATTTTATAEETTAPETTTIETTTPETTATTPETTVAETTATAAVTTAVTTVPETTTKKTTKATTTKVTTTKPKVNLDRIEIEDEGFSFFINIPSGYKLDESTISKYENGNISSRVYLYPKDDSDDENSKFLIEIGSYDNNKSELIAKGKTMVGAYGGRTVADKYTCDLGNGNKGVVYLIEVSTKYGSSGYYEVFVDYGDPENVIRISDIYPKKLKGSTNDPVKFLKEIFPS